MVDVTVVETTDVTALDMMTDVVVLVVLVDVTEVATLDKTDVSVVDVIDVKVVSNAISIKHITKNIATYLYSKKTECFYYV